MLRLRSLQTSIDENTRSIREHDNAKEHPEEPPPEIVVRSVVSLPPAIQSHYESERRERPSKKRWDGIKRIVEFCGIGLLAIYTAFTIGMYCANKKAANAAKSAADTAASQLQLSERPWLSIKGIKVLAIVHSDEPTEPRIKLEYDIENTGHGIAVLVGVFSELFPEDAGADKIAASITKECHSAIPVDNPEYGVLPAKPIPYNRLFGKGDKYSMPGLTLADPAKPVTVRNSGCVLYRSMADISPEQPNPKMHQTPFTARIIMKKDGKSCEENGGSQIVFSKTLMASDLCVMDLLVIGRPEPIN
jgi:hypothetical protein